MRHPIPWLVAFAICILMGSVFYSYITWLPIRIFDVFLLIHMTCSAVVVVWGYFRIYAIFDRMIDK